MKNKITIFLLALLITVLISGCNNNTSNESKLEEDLLTNLKYQMVEGSTIKELSVIKRLTDEKNKTDTVYVKVIFDHESATETNAYVMNYTLYNDGWLLDDVVEYWGNEVEHSVIPKKYPSNDFIMKQLIEYSNGMIDIFYEEQVTSDALKHTYFFEDGKYTSKIHSGNNVSDTEYTCQIDTTRHFNFMDVKEEQILTFYFNTLSYEWYLASSVIINTEVNNRLEGKWLVPSSGAIVEVNNTGSVNGIEAYLSYNVTCAIDNTTYESSINLSAPTSDFIPWNAVYFGDMFFEPINIHIYFTPDILLCRDMGYRGYEFELERIKD